MVQMTGNAHACIFELTTTFLEFQIPWRSALHQVQRLDVQGQNDFYGALVPRLHCHSSCTTPHQL
jgi:hypothetical protein